MMTANTSTQLRDLAVEIGPLAVGVNGTAVPAKQILLALAEAIEKEAKKRPGPRPIAR